MAAAHAIAPRVGSQPIGALSRRVMGLRRCARGGQPVNRVNCVGLLLAVLVAPSVRADEGISISEAKKDDSGVLVHEVRSPYQDGASSFALGAGLPQRVATSVRQPSNLRTSPDDWAVNKDGTQTWHSNSCTDGLPAGDVAAHGPEPLPGVQRRQGEKGQSSSPRLPRSHHYVGRRCHSVCGRDRRSSGPRRPDGSTLPRQRKRFQ